MTEEAWLACEELEAALRFSHDQASARKFWLFACACCRRVWDLLQGEFVRTAILVAEEYADGRATEERLERVLQQIRVPVRGEPWPEDERLGGAYLVLSFRADPSLRAAWRAGAVGAVELARQAAGHAAKMAALERAKAAFLTHKAAGMPHDEAWALFDQIVQTETPLFCRFLRDVVGNPFRPVRPDPAWLTPAVAQLAADAYEHRALPAGHLDPVRLAVLADALEEAGCSDADLLGHLRGPGPHVRGCWAVDFILGKE